MLPRKNLLRSLNLSNKKLLFPIIEDKLLTLLPNPIKMTNAPTFMIVDDDADDCEFFREAINEINPLSKCLTANDGEEALIKLRGLEPPLPDFIFLDLNMQRMDGRRCLAELKKDNVLKNIPVIILTTSSAQRDIDETKMLGASYYMTKPSEYQKLRKEIAFVMTRKWSGYSGIAS